MTTSRWSLFLDALTHSGPSYHPAARPQRGDLVEQWLKSRRDRFSEHHDTQWDVIDNLLDDYRLHADTGTPLDQHCCENGSVDDCYGCYEAAKAGPR
jgi:hypothetical protein